MDNIETGGPAFPVESTRCFDEFGMTLRDYFAAKAMSSTISNTNWFDEIVNLAGKRLDIDVNDKIAVRNAAIDHVAEVSYEFADAMLKARKGGAA